MVVCEKKLFSFEVLVIFENLSILCDFAEQDLEQNFKFLVSFPQTKHNFGSLPCRLTPTLLNFAEQLFEQKTVLLSFAINSLSHFLQILFFMSFEPPL
jgi:hypothetical protein